MAAGAAILLNLLGTLPLLIVWIGGLIYAATLWNRQRPVALLLASGSLLALFTEIASRIITGALPFLYFGASRSVARIGALIGAVGLASSLLMAVAWGLLLAAIVRALGPHTQHE